MEHGKLHIPVNGVDVDFYPETCFDDVIDTGTDLTLTQTLASVNQSITAEATARANADAALDDKIALKVATSTYDAKMLRLDESISSLSTNKLDASTYNTKMASLDGSISGLESNKADKSTTYTKTEADELYDGKVNKTGDTVTGGLTLSGTSLLGRRDVDTNNVLVCGGSAYNKGGYLNLEGKDASSGGLAQLVCNNGTKAYYLEIKSDGTTSAPTPATTDNSNKIATTQWVKNQFVLGNAVACSLNSSKATAGSINYRYIGDSFVLVSFNNLTITGCGSNNGANNKLITGTLPAPKADIFFSVPSLSASQATARMGVYPTGVLGGHYTNDSNNINGMVIYPIR